MKNDTDKVGELASEIAIRGAFLNQGLMMQETSPPPGCRGACRPARQALRKISSVLRSFVL